MIKQEKQCFVVVYRHRHGTDAWPTFRFNEPSEEEIIEELKDADMWSARNESDCVEVFGPFKEAAQKVERDIFDIAELDGQGLLDALTKANLEGHYLGWSYGEVARQGGVLPLTVSDEGKITRHSKATMLTNRGGRLFEIGITVTSAEGERYDTYRLVDEKADKKRSKDIRSHGFGDAIDAITAWAAGFEGYSGSADTQGTMKAIVKDLNRLGAKLYGDKSDG